ncbi:aldo/keto reductase, partial [Lentzea sp.]|uniref:aldo/keto reductase n=1 Tax=Lentzea sp. TaxID=56099 RepID=UPI002ED51AEF
LEAGINFFDTADMYSMGVSEEITGRALRAHGRMEEIVLATKVHFPMSDAPNMGGLSRKHVVQGCEASLKRLGVETIDLYQIHRWDGSVPLDETLAALDLLVTQGKVRYIGASSGPAYKLAKALALSDARGWARFAAMQNHYNLLYREEEREMLPLCADQGVAVIPWSPLARGRLTRDWDATTARTETDEFGSTLYVESDRAIVEQVAAVAADRGVSRAQVALAWLLRNPVVTAPIIGVTKLAQLDDAVAALDVELTDDEVRSLESAYEPHRIAGHS